MKIGKSMYFMMMALLTVMLAGCNSGTKSPAVADAAPDSRAVASGTIRDVDPAGLAALQQQGVTLIDIRRPEEWRETGIVAGSKTLTLFDARGGVVPGFEAGVRKLAPEGQPVALICRTGNRSAVGARLLAGAGYSRVYNVTGGIRGWKAEGRPVTTP
ncbi:MAG TPA: rhodanese-like domain-containing protein [Thiolinea sp.]|nr:rhodanese-like domain-containing protein [Thiolinea sp.]